MIVEISQLNELITNMSHNTIDFVYLNFIIHYIQYYQYSSL
jgi:hypothetical protein